MKKLLLLGAVVLLFFSFSAPAKAYYIVTTLDDGLTLEGYAYLNGTPYGGQLMIDVQLWNAPSDGHLLWNGLMSLFCMPGGDGFFSWDIGPNIPMQTLYLGFENTGGGGGVFDERLLITENFDLPMTFLEIGGWGLSLELTNIPQAAVPEPATMLLLGSGLTVLAGFRKKFKKS